MGETRSRGCGVCRGPVPDALGERETQRYKVLLGGPMRATENFGHVVRAPHLWQQSRTQNLSEVASERLFVKPPRPEPGKV